MSKIDLLHGTTKVQHFKDSTGHLSIEFFPNLVSIDALKIR